MKINDYNGEIIIITDLDKAIEQAKMFKDFRHVCGNYKKLDKKLKRYWTDIYFKLMKLKENGGKPGKLPSREQHTGSGGTAACSIAGNKKITALNSCNKCLICE